jgi:hypothetical protein
MAPGNFCNQFLQFLVIPGSLYNFWQFLVILGNFWQFLVISGHFWQFLVISGH